MEYSGVTVFVSLIIMNIGFGYCVNMGFCVQTRTLDLVIQTFGSWHVLEIKQKIFNGKQNLNF